MFRNKTTSTILDKLGFARFKGFSFKTLEALQQLYDEHFNLLTTTKDLTVTHNLKNASSPFQIHESICEIIANDLNNILIGHRIFAAHFAVKKAGSQGAFQLHQDWSITDESKYKNFQIWIPLNTSYPENGGLCFIPESHTFFPNMRSGSLSIPRIPITEEVYPYLSFYRLLKGEAVAFFTKTFHGSFINSSPEDRVGIILNVIDENAPTFYPHQINQHSIEKHAFDTKTLFNHLPALEKGELPFQQLISTETFHQRDNDTLQFEHLLNEITKRANEKNRAKDYEHKETAILLDEKLEIEINHKGFAIIEFLTIEEINQLKIAFGDFFPDRSLFSGSFSSMSALENEQRYKAHQAIQAIIQPRLEAFFKDFECPISLFYSRRPDGEHKLDWHSDPAFNFNEHIVPIYGIWCPLQAVTQACGGLKIIPGSHRLVPKLDLSFMKWKWPLDEFRDFLDRYERSFELAPGQALIYDTRMIHASDPNVCDFERDNIVMRVMPKNSSFFKFIRNNSQGGRLYSVSSNHFFSDSAKNHKKTPDEVMSTDFMFTFDYKLTTEKIKLILDQY